MLGSEKSNSSIFQKIFVFLFVIVVLSLEFCLYYFAIFSENNFPWSLIIVRVIGVICILYISGRRVNTNYKLSWSIFILVMPVTSTLVFFLFGNKNYIPQRKFKKIMTYISRQIPNDEITEKMKTIDPVGYRYLKLLHTLTSYPALRNTQAVFYADTSEKFEAMLQDMQKAQKFIFLEYFIVSKGYVWERVKKILLEKAKQGVEIKFIYDDIGSKMTVPKKDFRILNREKNITIRAYNPMGFSSLGMNYRDHRKICVIDGKYAYVGGDNLADEYIHRKIRFGYWRDNAIRIEGDAVYNFTLLFAQNWFMTTSQMMDVSLYKKEHDVQSFSIHMPFGDGPANRVDPAYDLMKSMIANAKNYVYISTPYFIIDEAFIQEIATAVSSGVDVRILVPHIPDKKFVFRMTRAHYRSILEAGGKIYEYTPGFNHAKNMISDDKYALMGTINCDYRSLFLHFECGDFMMYDPVILEMKKDFEQAVAASKEVTYEEWKKRSFYQKAIEFFLRAISPLL